MEQTNANLVSYCGFYCGACPILLKGKCEGCKGDSTKCAIGYKACKIRPCCIENNYSSCADCKKYDIVKKCKIYNPFLIRVGQFVARTDRGKGIEMIKEKGEVEFVRFMAGKNWVTVKTGKNNL
jgi:hypothetical protein